MTIHWQLDDARDSFEAIVRNAEKNRPQIVAVNEEPIVVVLAYQEYQRLLARNSTLAEFFATSPLVGADIDLERSRYLSRDERER